MIPIVAISKVREYDTALAASGKVAFVIDEVGFRVASFIRSTLGPIYGLKILVLIGKGNNGADAAATARNLRQFGARVDEVNFSWSDAPYSGVGYDLIVDGIFGTGISRPLQGSLIESGIAKVISIDLPSGVNLAKLDQDGYCVRADVTLVIGALKEGQLSGGVIDCMGEAYLWQFDDFDDLACRSFVFDSTDIVFRKDALDEHKWKRSLHVVGGSKTTLGAAVLAGSAALRSGAGLVRVSGNFERPELIQAAHPELIVGDEATFERDIESIDRFGCVVVGPGLGDRSERLLDLILNNYSGPVVVDADGINAVASSKSLQVTLRKYAGPILLTPHSGELDRLFVGLGLEISYEAIVKFTEEFGVDLLLKGFPTRIFSSDGRVLYVTSNRSNLSVAGSGDVLSGIIGAFVTRNGYSLETVATATYIHGLSGGRGVTNPISMIDSLSSLVDLSQDRSREKVSLPGNFKPIVSRGPLLGARDSSLVWRLPW